MAKPIDAEMEQFQNDLLESVRQMKSSKAALTSVIEAELSNRLADFERNPEAGDTWDQVKAKLENGSWRTARNE